MTEEERREMTRSNYAAQMEMLGYDASGNPLDMVHVVRCRDCKYSVEAKNAKGEYRALCGNSHSICCSSSWTLPEDWFCADGERRESE